MVLRKHFEGRRFFQMKAADVMLEVKIERKKAGQLCPAEFKGNQEKTGQYMPCATKFTSARSLIGVTARAGPNVHCFALAASIRYVCPTSTPAKL